MTTGHANLIPMLGVEDGKNVNYHLAQCDPLPDTEQPLA
jgi:hypothetical protein